MPKSKQQSSDLTGKTTPSVVKPHWISCLHKCSKSSSRPGLLRDSLKPKQEPLSKWMKLK